MRRWTLAQIRAKIVADLDLSDEVFISASEMTAYINEAIDAAEQEILKIDGDYFATWANFAITQGTSMYDLPTAIYAQKIRGLIYSNGSERYPIRKLREGNKPMDAEDIRAAGSSLRYRYTIVLDEDDGTPQIEFYPAPRETSATAVKIWYDRNSTELSDESDECDLPEAMNFVFAHVKQSCLAKEFLGSPPQFIVDEVKRQRQLLNDALSNRIPDNDDEIEADFSHYEEHS